MDYRVPVIYQHPLAYLLGIEGVALLRARARDHGREFVEARLAEVRRLLGDESLVHHGGGASCRPRLIRRRAAPR